MADVAGPHQADLRGLIGGGTFIVKRNKDMNIENDPDVPVTLSLHLMECPWSGGSGGIRSGPVIALCWFLMTSVLTGRQDLVNIVWGEYCV